MYILCGAVYICLHGTSGAVGKNMKQIGMCPSPPGEGYFPKRLNIEMCWLVVTGYHIR